MEPLERLTFDHAIERLRAFGTGTYRKDLPKALRAVQQQVMVTDEVSNLQGLVIAAAARRIDEIAREINPHGDVGSINLAANLRKIRKTYGTE
jgi:hypothetical protein